MTPLFRTISLSTLLLAGLAVPGMAQEEAPRRAQPRERAPRSEPAPQAAPPPAREAPPARQAPTPRQDYGGARRRGTDDVGRVRAPRDRGTREDRPEYGVPRRAPRERDMDRRRDAAPATASTAPAPEPESSAPSSAAPPASASSGASGDDQGRRRAVPRGSRPRGDNPAVGRAEPRDGRSFPRDGRARDGRGYPGSYGGSRVFTSRGRFYNNYYYYYPRRWYPYGYGAFGGLGYFYYDPYTWYSYDPYWSRPHHYRYYSSSRYYGESYYDTGELRLQVHPRHAEVYVDGYFAGHVDDFDGIFQGLRLEEGPYKIEVVAPGYETLVFDVRIIPGRKTTFRGELRPRP